MKRTLLLILPALLLSGQTQPAAVKTASAAKSPATTAKAPATPVDYKEMGSPGATVTLEAYTDYECPHCARFFKDFMPQFKADFVATGKVRFVHRDFPLPQHPHAVLAARFANAAGEVDPKLYDIVVAQIFKTQDTWSVNGPLNTGNIDVEVAKVVPPGAMQKIRDLVKSDTRIDASIAKDVAMANNVDHVPSTPTVVIVTKGKREVDSQVMELPYSVFKKYLEGKLAQ